MKKMYLVDVSSMFFRAFYAIRQLTSPNGMPTNAIYGFLSMLVKLLKSENPDYLVFCYDRKEPSFRKDLYTEYKANRTEMPEDLAPQIPYIKKLAELMGIPALEIAPYEADDIIGSMVKVGRNHSCEVYIVSGDKDFGQLIAPHVFLYDTMKDIKYDVSGVKEKWGIDPKHFIDYLAIVGDSSDNVPGVAGLGPKGAQKLIEEFGTLENIYENLEKISSKSVKQKLIDSKDKAFLSKKLVTICLDVPLSEKLDDYKMQPIQRDLLRAFLQELNFKSFEKTLLGDESASFLDTSSQTTLKSEGKDSTLSLGKNSNENSGVDGAEKDAVIERLASDLFSTNSNDQLNKTDNFNLENIELNEIELDAEALKVWLHPNDRVWAIPSERGLYFAKELNAKADVAILHGDYEEIGKICTQKNIEWLGYDLKSFFHLIKVYNPKVDYDLMLAAYVSKAGDVGSFNEVYEHYLQKSLPPLASPSQIYIAYRELHKKLELEVSRVHAQTILEDIENPLIPILYEMESFGIKLNSELLHKQSLELGQEISSLEKQIHKESGEHFNVASPKQLGFVLFEKLKLPVIKKTKTGYSTDTDVLEQLDHPIAKLVIQFRELSKLKSTYVDALPALVSPNDGRIHTKFNQALTTTGRLSSTHPNLQNIPIRTERGARVRQAFVADEGLLLLSADYSQIELRVLAHFSEDPNLIKAFEEDLDIHTATAAEVFGKKLSEVTPELRRTAKAINFGIAYGQGAFGLAENLGIARGEATDIIKRYFEKFKNVREYIDSTIKSAYEKSYVETLFGRRRYIDELKSKNGAIKKFGERAAINAPIQGTASDLVKKAMIEVHKSIKVKMLLQVHDELIFEGSRQDLEENAKDIISKMESVAKLRVPLKINYAIGKNWDEAH